MADLPQILASLGLCYRSPALVRADRRLRIPRGTGLRLELRLGPPRGRRRPLVSHARDRSRLCLPREITTETWLASELAGHVARWGVWIHGAPHWTAAVKYGADATDRKARRLASRVAALERAWDLLPSASRREHRRMVRRDLQRHAILARADAMPPSPVLDGVWAGSSAPRDELLCLGRAAGVCSAFFEEELASPEGAR